MTSLPSQHMTAQEWVDTVGWRMPPDECADYLRFVWGRNERLRKAGLPPLRNEIDERQIARLVERAKRQSERAA